MPSQVRATSITFARSSFVISRFGGKVGYLLFFGYFIISFIKSKLSKEKPPGERELGGRRRKSWWRGLFDEFEFALVPLVSRRGATSEHYLRVAVGVNLDMASATELDVLSPEGEPDEFHVFLVELGGLADDGGVGDCAIEQDVLNGSIRRSRSAAELAGEVGLPEF